MDPVLIACKISVSDALERGENRAGRYDHEITADEMHELRRLRLVDTVTAYAMVAGESPKKRLDVKAPTWDAVRAAIIRAKESAGDARRRAASIEAFLREWGDPSAVHRFLQGTLPEDELVGLARKVVFAPFSEFQRYDMQHRLDTSDIVHVEQPGAMHSADFESLEGAELLTGEHATFTMINRRAAAQPDAVVELRTHVAHCPACHAGATLKTAMVKVMWQGKLLTREYVLGEARPV